MAAPDVEYRCFVGGLAWATDDRSLEAAFSTYGEILDSKIINDRETGRSRGFGFVTFSSEQSMRDAIYMAIDIWRARRSHAEALRNPLKKQYVERNKKDNVVLDLSKSSDE